MDEKDRKAMEDQFPTMYSHSKRFEAIIEGVWGEACDHKDAQHKELMNEAQKLIGDILVRPEYAHKKFWKDRAESFLHKIWGEV